MFVHDSTNRVLMIRGGEACGNDANSKTIAVNRMQAAVHRTASMYEYSLFPKLVTARAQAALEQALKLRQLRKHRQIPGISTYNRRECLFFCSRQHSYCRKYTPFERHHQNRYHQRYCRNQRSSSIPGDLSAICFPVGVLLRSLLPPPLLLCTSFADVNQDVHCRMVLILLLQLVLSDRTRGRQRAELGRSAEGNLSIASATSADEPTRRPSKSAWRRSSRIREFQLAKNANPLRQGFRIVLKGVDDWQYLHRPPPATTAQQKLASTGHPTPAVSPVLALFWLFVSY